MLITPEMVQAAKLRLSVPVVLIEDDAECIILDYTVAQLQDVLAQLDEMAPLPPPCSAEAVAHHEAWMNQSEQMSHLARKAEVMALLTVPPEIQKVLHVINVRQLALRGVSLA
jgi:hypothetical protein